MTPRELESLLQSFVDGRLDDDSCEELVSLLKDDPHALETYCQYADLDAGLNHLSSGSVSHDLGSSSKGFSKLVRDYQSRQVRRITLVTSAVAVAALFLTLSAIWLKSPADPPATFSLGPNTKYTISHSPEAPFVSPSSIQIGSSLGIAKGTVELQFETGVRAVLEGPAFVTLEEEGILQLDHGAIWCDVPPQAVGFQIKTPSLEATDLGTRFAVMSFPGECEEVHVFNGRVAVATTSQESLITLSSGEAVTLNCDGRLIPKQADPSEFLTALPEERGHLHWRFDENDAGLQSIIGRIPGEPGITSRCATRDGEEPFAAFSVVDGRFGYALSSSGRNGLVRTNWNGLSKNSPFTLSYWIKIIPGQHSPYSLVSWGSGEKEDGSLFSSEVRKTARGSVTAVTMGSLDLEGTHPIDDGQWHHLVLRHDPAGAAVECYLDGKFEPLLPGEHVSHLVSASSESSSDPESKLTLLAHPRVEAETGKQVQLALIRENGLTSTYLNGRNIGVSKETPPFFESPSHLMIGANLDDAGQLEGFFTGTIDHLRLATFTGSLAASELLGSQGPSVNVVAEYSFDDPSALKGFQAIGDPQYQNGRLVLDGNDALILANTPLTATDNFIMEVRCTMTNYPTNPRRFAFPVSNGNGNNRGWGIIYHHTWGGIVMGQGPVGSATINENNIPVAIDELHLFNEALRPSEILNLFHYNQTTRNQPLNTNKP
ncbi:MAG: LamG-like jellyroll fold domain-containing protein [Akkermansiaceae bacterium]